MVRDVADLRYPRCVLAPGVVRRVAEVYMFDTCTHKCGYCWLAESGQVLDAEQLAPYRSPDFIDQVARFFTSRTSEAELWLVQLTGGEPLLAPNLDRLCDQLIEAGNSVAFYTALLLGEKHPSYRWLLKHPYPATDYVMGSFHPEAELDEERHFRKYRALKEAGHRVFFRFVGHPSRLERLEHYADRCRELDICFYPTTLFSRSYPGAYTDQERARLRSFFTSRSQDIQLEGGVDTTASTCWAGSRNIAIDLRTGDITPCVTVDGPVIGNLFDDRLELATQPLPCPKPGIGCMCDVHFQQNIVVGAEDDDLFERQAAGYVDPASLGRGFLAGERRRLITKGLPMYRGNETTMGDVQDDSRLIYSLAEIKANRVPRHFRAPVRIEVSQRRLDDRVAIRVRVEPMMEVTALEAYVNDDLRGATDGAWTLVGSVQMGGRSGEAEFVVDPPNKGRQRFGVNVTLSDGSIVYWYEQRAHFITPHEEIAIQG
jgi:organic radical activating enzyme